MNKNHAAVGSPARKVLVVSYYFPPAGGAGVQRMLKTVRYLRDYGWEPTVLTVRDGAFPEHDAGLSSELPPDIKIVRTGSWDPYRAFARLSGSSREQLLRQGSMSEDRPALSSTIAQWLRANFLLPDARVGWVPFAIRGGLELLRKEPHDAILTSGPPHSTHLAGRVLAARTGLPWLADFRDPWTDINYYHELSHTCMARAVDRYMERHVLQAADAVTTVSPAWRKLLQSKIPQTREQVHVVQNGYDPADMQKSAPPEDRFVVSHIGSLYASRNPKNLWHALGSLYRAGEIPKLSLQLAGTVDPSARKSIDRAGLSDVVTYRGYLEHCEATRVMHESHVLLLSIESFAHNDGMITGKLYEYLASGRLVLGIGPPEGDAATLIRSLKAGNMFSRDDEPSIRKALMDAYTTWVIGNSLQGAEPSKLTSYTRQAQTKRFANLLDKLVASFQP